MSLGRLLACAVGALIPVVGSADRVREIAELLPDRPRADGEPASNRKAWETLDATPESRSYRAAAETALAAELPELPDELYREFHTPGNGNRRNYETRYMELTGQIAALTLGECLAYEGRYVAKLVTCIEALCAMKTWVLPAHDKDMMNFEGRDITIDLVSGDVAYLLTTVDGWLGKKLPVETRKLIRRECQRRVFEPYRKDARSDAPRNWWFRAGSNWNAVCHDNCVRAALAILPDRTDRALFVAAAEEAMDAYLEGGFLPDGYCTEGMSYWDYGFGNFLRLALSVRRATGGKVNFAASPKARKVMEYGWNCCLGGRNAPRFADGSGDCIPLTRALGRQLWPDLVDGVVAAVPPLTGTLPYISLRAFGQEASLPEASVAARSLPLRTWFPDAQVYVGRSDGFALGAKGGTNGELHNHNDIGSYSLFLDGIEVAGDPGGEVYTARTFSKQRYESKVLSSYGHPVPVVAGELQSAGAKFRARIAGMTFKDGRDDLTLDLAAAYAAPVTTLTRRFSFDRRHRRVYVADSVKFPAPAAFESAFVTFADVTRSEDGKTLRYSVTEKGKTVNVRVDVVVKGGDWHWTEEVIENPGRRNPRRLAVVLDAPQTAAEIVWRISSPEPSGVGL